MGLQHRLSFRAVQLFGACTALALGAAVSAAGAASPSAELDARYQAEVAACRNGSSGQTLDACLLEARNARAEAKKGQLGAGASVDPENALRRCDAFQGDDRSLCRARMQQGATSGSVPSGGVLREYRTVEPAPGASGASR